MDSAYRTYWIKNGGSIVTNYDKTKTLSDSSSIKLGIISYLENELLILKVDLNNNFSKKLQDEDQHLQEIIQFVSGGPGKQKLFPQWLDGDKEKIGKKLMISFWRAMNGLTKNF